MWYESYRDWESCMKEARYLEKRLWDIDRKAEEIIDALSTATRARRRRMFKELDRLARKYDGIEADIDAIIAYANANFTEPEPEFYCYGCAYAI